MGHDHNYFLLDLLLTFFVYSEFYKGLHLQWDYNTNHIIYLQGKQGCSSCLKA